MLSVLELPVSVAAVISGVAGAAAVVSMVMLRPPEAADTFPAASVALAVMLYVPSASALLAMLQFPLPSAVSVPIRVPPPRNICTVLLASAVPVKVGVVTLVMLSVLDVPLSLAAVMSGAEGAAGALVSIVMLRAPEAPDTLPAVSVAVAVMLCVPAVRALGVMV